MVSNSTDVMIVGGGPAGLAAALALRLRGASVTVADARKPPIDKACGEGLMPDSLQDLAMLGVQLSAADGAAFQGIRFVNYARGVEERSAVATAQFPAGGLHAESGIGLRRQRLHGRLVEAAEASGVQLRWESAVHFRSSHCREDSGLLVAGEPVRYSHLIGADGQSSRVRRWAGLERGAVISRRFGFRQHFHVEPWSDFVEVHWGRSGQAYVTPVGPNEVCVASVAQDPHCRLQNLLDELPWLRSKLKGRAIESLPAVDAERGALTTTRRLARVAVDRVALLGDASGSADAITGEGMGMAFRQALLLAECIEKEDVARYNRMHPQILKLPQTMARVMLMLDRSATFRDRALGMLASEPTLFGRMLGVHLGAESLPRFVATRGLEVAWHLAIPSNHAALPA